MNDLSKQPRYKLPLGKFPVAQVTHQLGETKIDIHIGDVQGTPLFFSAVMLGKPDVRVGDILTIYTEVLIDAQPEPTSVQ